MARTRKPPTAAQMTRWSEEVARVCAVTFGVVIDPKALLPLIGLDEDLVGELRLCRGSLTDTASRDAVGQFLVTHVMGDTEPEHRDSMIRVRGYKGWHWPLFGSGDEYAAEFREKFVARAVSMGYRVSAAWNDEEDIESGSIPTCG